MLGSVFAVMIGFNQGKADSEEDVDETLRDGAMLGDHPARGGI